MRLINQVVNIDIVTSFLKTVKKEIKSGHRVFIGYRSISSNGKIVNELLDYGTDIGISSRGAGSVGPDNVVDPDYQFVTFDFVARPSCEAARLNMIVESVQPEIDTNSDDKVKNILEGYKTSLKDMLKIDIFSEESAIKTYTEHKKIIKDKYIREMLSRIILDEKRHLEIFKEMLSNLN